MECCPESSKQSDLLNNDSVQYPKVEKFILTYLDVQVVNASLKI